MISWCCPADGTPLRPGADSLKCESCGTEYEVDEGVARFARPGPDAARIARPLPLLDELADSMRDLSASEAAQRFCRRHGCQRVPQGADWKLLLPVASGSSVLEIGPGFGDTTLDLAARADQVVALTSHLASARILRGHAEERGSDNVQVGVAARLDRLPFPDDSFDAVALSHDAARSFGVSGSGWPGLAAELRRVCAPQASVLIGLANPLHRLPGAAALRSRIQSGDERTLDGVLQDALAPPAGGGWGLGKLERVMRDGGFSNPTLFAPIPNEERARAVVPVRDTAVVLYLLEHLVRRNAPLIRATLAVFSPLVRLGLFPRLVPYWFVVFSDPSTGGGSSGG